MTPSQAIVASANERDFIQDASGRRLEVRKLTPVDTLRLLKAAGPVLSENNAWLNMAALAMTVMSIADIPVPSPATETQIEAIIGQLGDDGISAVSLWSGTLRNSSDGELAATAGN
jgi:hypothetical protein